MCQFRGLILAVCVLVPLASQSLRGEEYAEPYDGLKASEDAHRYFDARRQEAIRRQLNTIEWMRWWAGFPASPRPDTVYYRDPPSLDYIYGTNRWSRLGPYGRAPGPMVDIFEPWPFVPGDIYGYPFFRPVRQPIGRREIQTGPNRWESHPIFAHDVAPPKPAPKPLAPPVGKPKAKGPRRF